MRILSKVLLILIFTFIIRLISGCCDCDESSIPFNFNRIEITNLDNSGEWAITSNSDTMKPEAVAFELALFDSTGYFYTRNPSLNSMGFGQARAMSCDCSLPFKPNQHLTGIRITSLYALNPESGPGADVSSLFLARPTNNSFSGSLYSSLETICNETNGKIYYDSGVESFGLYLTVPVSVNRVRFVINIHLSDDTILTDTTRLIFIRNN